ncbi:MAG: response regulator [Gammaproteobacteria bacterium]|nr:response regulator [Gammaproteobacteria bacterium]MCW8924269.1 response regulator [Gammaproteobacteria bacterium]
MPKKSILIVDDDAISRAIIQGFLKNESDYITKTVVSAQDCLNFIKNNHVDLIISDVEMEEIDGIEMSKILSSNQKTSEIPVILISVRNQLDIINKSRLYNNVKKVEQKPYCKSLLLSDVKEVCNLKKLH